MIFSYINYTSSSGYILQPKNFGAMLSTCLIRSSRHLNLLVLKYVGKAWSLIFDAFRNNRGLEGANADLALLIVDAPPSDTLAAIDSVEYVTRSLPTAAIILDLVQREKRLRKDLNEAVENATLAVARDQLSSREMAEISRFHHFDWEAIGVSI